MNRLLAIFATISLITLVSLLGWLLFDFIKEDSSTIGYLRAMAAVFGPVPVLIFAAFLMAGMFDDLTPGLPNLTQRGISIGIFVGLAILVPLLAPVLPTMEVLRRIGAAAIFVNSWLFCLAILNFTIIRNLLVAAGLCGLSLGITIHIIYS
jgi:hypothetical protein